MHGGEEAQSPCYILLKYKKKKVRYGGKRRQEQAFGPWFAALIGDSAPEAAAPPEKIIRDSRRVPIEHLEPNPRNPRKTFTEKDLADLRSP